MAIVIMRKHLKKQDRKKATANVKYDKESPAPSN